MDEEEKRRIERDMEQTRREMHRKSRDTIRIYNPLDTDFKFFYDGYPNVIRAHQTKDVERYKARLYFNKIADFMIGQLATAKGLELLEERRKRGVPEFLDKYVENREIWDKVPKQDDRTLLEDIGDKVILGLVEEYGLELPDDAGPADYAADNRPVRDQIVEMFDKRIAADEPELTPNQAPIKEKLAMEVTSDGN